MEREPIEAPLLASGVTAIAGVDEAGRGACAGPLVVAALIFRDPLSSQLNEVVDSKELSSQEREYLRTIIIDQALTYSMIVIEPDEIDEIGLHRANLQGMRRAVSSLNIEPGYVLTDGYPIAGLASPSLAVWKGDQVARTISGASILAKTERDRIMVELDQKYPGYGLALHKGYVTRSHQQALENLGVTAIHRRSYANIARLINT